MTVTHDETRASVAKTRRARRQLDDAASYLEVAAFAALMGGTADDLTRMTGCTEAITTPVSYTHLTLPTSDLV